MALYASGRKLPTGVFAASYDPAPGGTFGSLLSGAGGIASSYASKEANKTVQKHIGNIPIMKTGNPIADIAMSYVPTPSQPVPWNNPNTHFQATATVADMVTGAPSAVNPGRPNPHGGMPIPNIPPTGRVGRGAGPKRIKPTDVMQFPKDLGISSEHSHYMMFTTFAIKGTVGASGSDNSFGEEGASVALPIPGNPTATYEQGWDTQEAGFVMSGLITSSQEIEQAYNAPVGPPGRGHTAGLEGAITAVSDKLSKEGKTIAAGGILGNVGKAIGNRALGQATGTAVFDQSFAVYGGPAYRTFSFNFALMPLSEEDVFTIKDIVDYFKINSSPESKGPGSVARIYGLPKAFGIKYMTPRGENQYMNKIGKCALTSINVTYGGERFTTFDGMDAPVQVNLTLAFKELQLQDSKSLAAGY